MAEDQKMSKHCYCCLYSSLWSEDHLNLFFKLINQFLMHQFKKKQTSLKDIL